ncbi:archaellin/type IV pilin N-terminal domain-containing protein [Methanoculleus receptaculi]|uniref:Flagellin n=1 Tax=Methanoculleus receptaculi TaxID=394967 RepID=A0AAX4FTN5_9EURY|nr:archaellin/type IV pilin N-terminal domain-containing protein [Methanoculleus receptaculi]WOX57279.1 archaellin/type IV pilin N-terminal domain-containing protein [Methanoculleus receptaculi]
MSKLIRNEEGFTGLEAAIVLIAFVVVAAVFSYVMLGAGFFATGEAQRTVHTGVGQATSNLEVSGPVIVKATDTTNLGEIAFFLQLAAGGAPVDMEKVTFTVSTANDLETYTFGGVKDDWYVNGTTQQSGNNNMLDKFEMVKITIPNSGGTLPEIGPNARFTVEVKPDIGAALPINRIAPADFQAGHYYEVY